MSTEFYVLIETLRGQVTDLSYAMLAAADSLSKASAGRVTAVFFGREQEAQAAALLADRILLVDQPALREFCADAWLEALHAALGQGLPRLFFFGHTTIGMDLLCGLAVRLGAPVISQCLSLRAEGERLRFTCQVCAGKLMAEGTLPDGPVLVSMAPGAYKPEAGQRQAVPPIERAALPAEADARLRLVAFQEPDKSDVDIRKEPVLVAIGRGLQNQADLAVVENLARGLGGTVVASRPMVDLGWLPSTRLVGKSGSMVAPKLYLALGISGAPEHIEGMRDSELIIAVNTDPTAPIFAYAHYGVEADLITILEALNEQLMQAT
jgi:electron transfer flavoprotein alpha subunit